MLALFGCFGSFSGCSERGPAPSVLLITIDTLRPDRLSCYGYKRQQTPAICSLALQGALFEQAVCDIPWTTGSLASVMTGTYSTQHGLHLSNERLGQSHLTLAELLKQHGYRTGAVVGSFPVASLYGLNQGFDSYDDEFTQPILIASGPTPHAVQKIPNPSNLDDLTTAAAWANQKMRNDGFRPDADVTERAGQWLDDHVGSRFFLWVHYFGPHERLYDIENTLLSWQEPRIVADYDGDLAKTDAAVGRLLAKVEALGLAEQVLVVLHADHGQSLGEHRYVGHSMDLYDVSLRVPLMMRLPGRIRPGTRIGQLVRNVDIMPTVLDTTDVPVPPNLAGRSLLPALSRRSLPAALAYAETYIPTIVFQPLTVPEVGVVLGPTTRHAIRSEKWKFIENQLSAPCSRGTAAFRTAAIEKLGSWDLRDATPVDAAQCNRLRIDELYDLSADPGEVTNLAGSRPEVVAELSDVLHAVAERKRAGEKIELSPSDKERLRSLGYQTGED
jgi:arylsulfatase A-like enzyme